MIPVVPAGSSDSHLSPVEVSVSTGPTPLPVTTLTQMVNFGHTLIPSWDGSPQALDIAFAVKLVPSNSSTIAANDELAYSVR